METQDRYHILLSLLTVQLLEKRELLATLGLDSNLVNIQPRHCNWIGYSFNRLLEDINQNIYRENINNYQPLNDLPEEELLQMYIVIMAMFIFTRDYFTIHEPYRYFIALIDIINQLQEIMQDVDMVKQAVKASFQIHLTTFSHRSQCIGGLSNYSLDCLVNNSLRLVDLCGANYRYFPTYDTKIYWNIFLNSTP